MNEIENSQNYNVLERICMLLRYCTTDWDPRGNQIVSHCCLKDKGLLCNKINKFLIYYIEVSIKEDLDWDSYIPQWFSVLDQ